MSPEPELFPGTPAAPGLVEQGQIPTSTLPFPTEPTPTSSVQAVATSRGPDLEATDPSTVSLASGGLQLVEFFRFT